MEDYRKPTTIELIKQLHYEMELALIYKHNNKKQKQYNAQFKKTEALVNKIKAM